MRPYARGCWSHQGVTAAPSVASPPSALLGAVRIRPPPGMTISSHAQATAAIAELAPTGLLRVGLIEAPAPGLIFVSRAADGQPEGVTADLSADLARKFGLSLAVTLFPNSGAAAAALQAETIDVSFMPVDATRRQVLAFGPGYYDLESTDLASGASGIVDVAQVDRPGIRVLAIDGTTTFRASARTLKSTQPVAVSSVAEAIRRMCAGQADAFALSRDTLRPVELQVPGSRIVSGGFQQTQVAVAVPQGRPGALASVTAWLDEAKRAGVVRRIFDARGFGGDAVAP
jgi:polar amino acid transport system substrate-binding protein